MFKQSPIDIDLIRLVTEEGKNVYQSAKILGVRTRGVRRRLNALGLQRDEIRKPHVPNEYVYSEVPSAVKKQKLKASDLCLISRHYDEVYKVLSVRLKNNGMLSSMMTKQNLSHKEVVDRAASFLPEVTLKYDPKKMPNFVNYAGIQCIFRLIDSERDSIEIGRLMFNRHQKIGNYQDESIKACGYENSDLIKEIMKEDSIPDAEINRIFVDKNRGVGRYDDFPRPTHKQDEFFEFRDGPDFLFPHHSNLYAKDDIIRSDWEIGKYQFYEEFLQWGDYWKSFDHARQGFAIVVDYIIPLAENRLVFSIKELGQRFGLCESTMSNIKKDMFQMDYFQDMSRRLIGLPDSIREEECVA